MLIDFELENASEPRVTISRNGTEIVRRPVQTIHTAVVEFERTMDRSCTNLLLEPAYQEFQQRLVLFVNMLDRMITDKLESARASSPIAVMSIQSEICILMDPNIKRAFAVLGRVIGYLQRGTSKLTSELTLTSMATTLPNFLARVSKANKLLTSFESDIGTYSIIDVRSKHVVEPVALYKCLPAIRMSYGHLRFFAPIGRSAPVRIVYASFLQFRFITDDDQPGCASRVK
jgi:hypothetical protein